MATGDAHAAVPDERGALTAVVIHAMALHRLQVGLAPARIALDIDDDVRPAIWGGLRGALERLEAHDQVGFASVHSEVQELSRERIARIDAERESAPRRSDRDLDRALREGAPTAHPRAPLQQVLLRAHAIDHLRVLNQDGVIFGQMGEAARRWAWTDLHEAVLRLAREERTIHDRLADHADELITTAEVRLRVEG